MAQLSVGRSGGRGARGSGSESATRRRAGFQTGPPLFPDTMGPRAGDPSFTRRVFFKSPAPGRFSGGARGPGHPIGEPNELAGVPNPPPPPVLGTTRVNMPPIRPPNSSVKLSTGASLSPRVIVGPRERGEKTAVARGARRAAIAAAARPPAGTMRARRPRAALVAAGLLAAAAGAPRAARAQAEAEVVRFVYPAPPPAPDAELAESWTEDSRDGIYNLDWQGDPTLGVSAARNGGQGPVPPPAGTPRSGSASAGARRQWLGATRRSTRPPALHGEPQPEPRRRDGRGEPPPPHLPFGAFAAASTTPPWALGDSIARERPRATQRLRG